MADMGGNLRRIMRREGVGVRELSRRTNLSLSTVRRLRSVANSGNVATWFAIADALGVDIIEFFDETCREG
jgi:transcriptional regulator with XRE-family HTH domain